MRCHEAGVPGAEITAKSKTALALELVREARAKGVRFSWVGADGGYGKEPAFLGALDDDGELFIVDVHRNQMICPEDPAPSVPEKKPGRGRRPSRRVAQSQTHPSGPVGPEAGGGSARRVGGEILR